MGRVSRFVCHLIILVMVASVSPRSIASDSDRQEARKERQQQEREARNAEQREEAARRRQENEHRQAQKQERNEQERRERDKKRARDEDREKQRQERAAEKQRERGEREARNLAQDAVRERREKENEQQRGAGQESHPQQHSASSNDRSTHQNDGASIDSSTPTDSLSTHNRMRHDPEGRENPEGRNGKVDRPVDKGKKKPTVEATQNQDLPIEGRNGKLGRDGASTQRRHTSKDQQKLDEMARQLNENPSIQRLREFTPERITELKNNGKSAELNRYIKEGGRKPEIDVLDPKSGHWVTSPSTTGRVTVPLQSNANKGPSQSRGMAVALTPQPERYRGDLSGTDAFRSSNDQEWVVGLSSAQRRALNQYPPEQLIAIQKSGRWPELKRQIVAHESEGIQWGVLKSDQPNQFMSDAKNTTANSTPAHPTPGTPDTGGLLLDGAQIVLGAAGLTPGAGNGFDLANSGISALRGNKADAALDLASAIPGTGGVAGVVGITRRVNKVINVPQSVPKGTLFENQLPGRLGFELREAARMGVVPIGVNNKNFEQVINQGTIKFVVTKDGELLIAPHTIGNVEISHAAISGGQPVLSAGEANIARHGGITVGSDIRSWSGHYQPDKEISDIIARDAFAKFSITFPEQK